jgi:D-alanine-D-alanine ligase-like ATP-grasp enzyme
MIESKPYYTYVIRSLIRLFSEGRLDAIASIDVEPLYGYVARIHYRNGTVRVVYGNDLGLNTGASSDLAKDKGFTKFMLRKSGITVADGKEFILPNWSRRIEASYAERGQAEGHSHASKAVDYVETELDWPVYVKPVSGSKGGDVYRVTEPTELTEILDEFDQKMVRIAVVEAAIEMPDYRIVVLDGQLISAYRRVPLTVLGNGTDTLRDLIIALRHSFINDGRDTQLTPNDPRILHHLASVDLSLDFVPATGKKVTLVAISNLSAGGTSIDVTSCVAPEWVELCVRIAKSFNLRLCGVDLACSDIQTATSNYVVIEVNASPGLDHYALSGNDQMQVVDDLYTRVLNVPSH